VVQNHQFHVKSFITLQMHKGLIRLCVKIGRFHTVSVTGLSTFGYIYTIFNVIVAIAVIIIMIKIFYFYRFMLQFIACPPHDM